MITQSLSDIYMTVLYEIKCKSTISMFRYALFLYFYCTIAIFDESAYILLVDIFEFGLFESRYGSEVTWKLLSLKQ